MWINDLIAGFTATDPLNTYKMERGKIHCIKMLCVNRKLTTYILKYKPI
jgi:hypothetical protein